MKLSNEQLKQIEELSHKVNPSISALFDEVCIILGEEYHFVRCLGRGGSYFHELFIYFDMFCSCPNIIIILDLHNEKFKKAYDNDALLLWLDEGITWWLENPNKKEGND